mmetsp:Transcript_23236/g.46198  ORF Transcript_23236/g.46198 Transcript_23236/m.46198 type:complete len:206 (+) Transcript_23236:1835-2452(+)
MNWAAMCIDSLRSSLVLSLPVHTKRESPQSKMYASLVSSMSRVYCSFSLRLMGVMLTAPDASDTWCSLMSARLTSAFSSDSPVSVTSICPPRASQKVAQSLSTPSTMVMLPFAPRSSLIFLIISAPLAFSYLLACAPFHKNSASPKSRMKLSPLFKEAAASSFSVHRTARFPLHCSKRGRYTSRSTLLKPDSMPPLRYSRPVSLK